MVEIGFLVSRYAIAAAFVPPVVLLAVASVLLFRLPAGKVAWTVLGITLAVSLLAIGSRWGWALDATATERAFAKRYPDYGPPIHCQPGHQELAGPVWGGKVYDCVARGIRPKDALPVAVDNHGIIEVWP